MSQEAPPTTVVGRTLAEMANDSRAGGMVCPRCGFEVLLSIKSRRLPTGETARCRECRRCKCRVWCKERIVAIVQSRETAAASAPELHETNAPPKTSPLILPPTQWLPANHIPNIPNSAAGFRLTAGMDTHTLQSESALNRDLQADAHEHPASTEHRRAGD